jgi:hypothetical protein
MGGAAEVSRSAVASLPQQNTAIIEDVARPSLVPSRDRDTPVQHGTGEIAALRFLANNSYGVAISSKGLSSAFARRSENYRLWAS